MADRRGWAVVLAVLGAGAVGLGFWLQSQANAKVAADRFAATLSGASPYGGREVDPVPWVVGIVGGVLLLLALVLWVTAPAAAAPTRAKVGILPPIVPANVTPPPPRPVEAPPVPMGWHDDPHDPALLRYHDGAQWTDRTAAKS